MTPTAAQTMARYNRWMNERLFAECDQLPDAARRQDRGAPFRSIHGTLNHLLLGDSIWMGRFTGEPFSVRSLDQELHADWDDLRAARTAMDDRIVAWAAGLTPEALAADLSFITIVRPQPWTVPLWFAVQHFFNHQTHHRGQITVLLEQAGGDCGVTDLLLLPGGPGGDG